MIISQAVPEYLKYLAGSPADPFRVTSLFRSRGFWLHP